MAIVVFLETTSQYLFYWPSVKLRDILHDQLHNYLTKFDLFSGTQFGIRKLHFTTGALLDCINEWYINLDRKMFNLVVLIGLKKAFDTVNHQILLSKIQLYGIKRTSSNFVQNWKQSANWKKNFNGAPDDMWCTTRLDLRVIILFVVHQWSTSLPRQHKTKVVCWWDKSYSFSKFYDWPRGSSKFWFGDGL